MSRASGPESSNIHFVYPEKYVRVLYSYFMVRLCIVCKTALGKVFIFFRFNGTFTFRSLCFNSGVRPWSAPRRRALSGQQVARRYRSPLSQFRMRLVVHAKGPDDSFWMLISIFARRPFFSPQGVKSSFKKRITTCCCVLFYVQAITKKNAWNQRNLSNRLFYPNPSYLIPFYLVTVWGHVLHPKLSGIGSGCPITKRCRK